MDNRKVDAFLIVGDLFEDIGVSIYQRKFAIHPAARYLLVQITAARCPQ